MGDIELPRTSQEIKRVDLLCEALANKNQLLNRVKEHLKLKKKPRKTTIVAPSYVDKFCHRRNVAKSTEKYFTTGRYCGPERDFSREPNPYSVPEELDLFKNAFKFHKEAPPTRQKHAYMNSTDAQGILKDLRVESAKGVVPKGKIEEDPDYFAVADKRPIKEHFLRRKFARDHKKCFFRKLCVGFIQDEMKRKEEQHLLDLWHLNNIRDEFDNVIQTFERYLADDHQESVKVIQQASEIIALKEAKLDHLKRCRSYVNAIKCTLYKMEEQLATRKYCKLALYKLSPTWWQTEFNADVRQYRPVLQETVDQVMKSYESFCRYNTDPERDRFLNEVINTFTDSFLSLGPPRMHFQSTDEIDLVFRQYEHACLRLIKQIKAMKQKKGEIEEERIESQAGYEQELSAVATKIEQLKKGIRYEQGNFLKEQEEEQKQGSSEEHIQEAVNLITLFYTEIIGGAMVSIEEMLSLVEKRVIDVVNEAQNIFRLKYKKFKGGDEAEKTGPTKNRQHVSRETEIRSSTFLLKNVLTPPPYQEGWKGLIRIPLDAKERASMREEMATARRREPDDEPDEVAEIGNLIRDVVAPDEAPSQPSGDGRLDDSDGSIQPFDPEEIYQLFEPDLADSDDAQTQTVANLSSVSFYPREEFTEMIAKAWAHPLSVGHEPMKVRRKSIKEIRKSIK